MPLRLLPVLLFIAACAWAQPPAIPDTPAGHTLQAWFDSFNSGDRARIQAYLTKYEPTKPLDATVGFREQTGGFVFRRSEEHTSELQSHLNLVCRLLLEKKKKISLH